MCRSRRRISFGTTKSDNTGNRPVNPIKESPIVQVLIKEGPAAVEPLLECLANDRRLTRVAGLEISLAGVADFLPRRNFMGVDQAAYAALCGIMKVEGFGPQTEKGYYHGCDVLGPEDCRRSLPKSAATGRK